MRLCAFFLTLCLMALCFALPQDAQAQSCGNGGCGPTVINAQSTAEKQVAAGWVFMAGSTNLSVGIGANLRYVIVNPANSTRTCYVFAIDTFATTLSYGQVYTNPTVVPTTNRASTNVLVGSPNTSNCTVASDASSTAMSGGTTTTVQIGIPANSYQNIIGPPLALLPGNSVGIDVPVTVAASINVMFFWYEQ